LIAPFVKAADIAEQAQHRRVVVAQQLNHFHVLNGGIDRL
jgi:hypothetical protein